MIKKIKTGIILSLLMTIIGIPTFAAWLNSVPQTIVQPDGTVIECFATGDEFYNWLHDADGYTIIQNKETGYYNYATLAGDELVSSAYVVGQINPSVAGLTPWTNISGEQMKAKRTAFLKNQMPPKTQLPGYSNPKSTQNEGTLNNIVVYITFSDQTEFPQDTMTYWNMFNNDTPGYNSMINYYNFVSYEQLSLPSWFYPIPSGSTVISYQDIYPRSHFMPYNANTNPDGYTNQATAEHALLKRAVNYIEDEVPEDIDLDYDNDGYVDNMVFIVRGTTTAWSTLLWPHRWVLYSQTVYIHGKRVYDYNLQLETSLGSSGTGVLCHEMFHTLSAPDLYHYESAPYSAVGPWDIMEQDLNPPQSMGAYMKYRYGGWIDDIPEITECGTYTLNPVSESENNCFKIASPNSNTDYFVVEYRVKEGTFEGSLPSSGLLVYRINALENGNGNAQGPPDEVYVYRPGGSNTTNGNVSNANFAADFNRTEINDDTDPDPFLTNGQPGGLDISNVGFIGETISFDVNFEKEPVAEFQSSETLLTEGCTVDFTDLSYCYVDEWEWTFEGGTPSTSTDQSPQGIVYQNAGTYNVTLKTTNEFGENTIVKSDFIEVSTAANPEVIFYASDSAVCTNSAVVFSDYSTVCPETWSWEISPSSYEFVNGTNASSQNPEVQFNNPGNYSVSLTVSNANGSTTLNKTDYILAGGSAIPFFEDFESGNTDQNGWTIVNPDNDNTTWEIYSVSGNGGTKAAGINLFNYTSVFKRDQLISPPLDLSGINNAFLKFEHAYALKDNPNYSDSLIVKVSGDCGNNWTTILQLADDGSGNFATHPASSTSFVPITADDWCGSGYGSACFETNISQWAGQSNVMVMFESVRLVGNNMFIDNVSVNIQTDIKEENISSSNELNVFPNPTNGKIAIESNNDFEQGRLMVYSSLGAIVFESIISEGQRQLSYDLSGYPNGMYIIRIIGETYTATKKITIK